jgi:hypothetical protein
MWKKITDNFTNMAGNVKKWWEKEKMSNGEKTKTYMKNLEENTQFKQVENQGNFFEAIIKRDINPKVKGIEMADTYESIDKFRKSHSFYIDKNAMRKIMKVVKEISFTTKEKDLSEENENTSKSKMTKLNKENMDDTYDELDLQRRPIYLPLNEMTKIYEQNFIFYYNYDLIAQEKHETFENHYSKFPRSYNTKRDQDPSQESQSDPRYNAQQNPRETEFHSQDNSQPRMRKTPKR